MSVVLNGTNQALRISSQFGLGDASQNGFTISAFFKRSRVTHGDNENIAARAMSASSTSYAQMEIQNTTNIVRARRYAGASDTAAGPAITSTSTWYHAAAYFPPADGVSRTLRFWLDGVQEASTTSTRSSTAALETFYIGRAGGTINLAYFGGKIANVSILQGEATLAEVGELGTKVPSAITFSAATPLAFWPLLDDPESDIGSYTLEEINSPTYDTGDHPTLTGGGGGGGDPDTFLIVPRRQLFVSRRVIQH